MTATAAPAIDRAVEDMEPVARRLTAAVRDRNPDAIDAAVADALDIRCHGRHPLVVLAVVLADHTDAAQRDAAPVWAERERCRRHAVGVIHSTTGDVVSRARRLPALIAQGARA